MSNKLKQITTKAKQLYKTGKFAKWTDAIKAASGKVVKRSKIGAAGDYAKFEIATIKSLAKVLKKSLKLTQQLVNNDENLLNIISDSFDKKLTPLQTAKVIKKELTPEPKTDKLKAFVNILNKGAKGKTTGSKNFPMKIPATVTIGKLKKKTPAKSYHKDSKSHNVKISVVSGIENDKLIRKLSSKFLLMTGHNQLAKDVLKKHIPISNVMKVVDFAVNEQFKKVQSGNYSKALKEKSIKVKNHWDAYKKAFIN